MTFTNLWHVAILESMIWAKTQGAVNFRPGVLDSEGGSAFICVSMLGFHQGMPVLTRPGELVSKGGGRWGVLLRRASLR